MSIVLDGFTGATLITEGYGETTITSIPIEEFIFDSSIKKEYEFESEI